MGYPKQITVNLSILLTVLIFHPSFSTVSSTIVTAVAKHGFEIPSQKERVDISIYDRNYVREIRHDTLQVIRNLDQVHLECHSTKNASWHVNWKYHGLGLAQDIDLRTRRNLMSINLTSGPPVVRMECSSGKNQSISNSTLIYTGDDKPPYLYKHGESVEIKVLNETTVRLPCILKYPIENKEHLKLQLFKDDKEVPNECLSYAHELGYFFNLTKLEDRYGKYECKVVNSTKDDLVKMVLHSDDLFRADVEVVYKGYVQFFWAGSNNSHLFQCQVPDPKFQNKFQWFYRYTDGTYEVIAPEKSNRTYPAEPQHYMDSVKIKFPSRNITHVVCAGFLMDGVASYNNTLAVKVKDAVVPRIVNDPEKKIIKFGENTKNLTCVIYGDPLDFEWHKNGKPVKNLNNIYIRYSIGAIQKSTLTLNPAINENDMNYTCVVSNFLAKESFTFRVQLPDEESPVYKYTHTTLTFLGIVFSITVIIARLVIS